MAANNGHLSVCEFLLEKGIIVDIKNKILKTPLHIAAIKGH